MASERLKASRYLTRVELDDSGITLLYGGLLGRLIEVPSAQRARVAELLEDPNRVHSELGSLRQELSDQGMLVPEDWDERSLVEQRSLQAQSKPSHALNLTVCPTINCNLRCTYCYQQHVGKLMPPEVRHALMAFVRDQDPDVRSLRATWFGGEPLMGLSQVIEPLTAQFREVVGENYAASIITNGWLLTEDVSTRLAELDVTSVQVTLDGTRDVHNTRRPRIGGRETFDRILENLATCDKRLSIAVRVNTDQRNADASSLLFDQLEEAGLQGRVMVYFAPVIAYTEVCADTAGHCIAGRDWSDLSARLQFEAFERGFGGPALPSARTGVCIADNPRGWVITPDGLIYKCWNDVTDPLRAVGDLLDRASPDVQAHRRQELHKWQSWSPFKLKDCNQCKVLPQCHSGCAHVAMQQPGDITRGHCTELKWNLEKTVATYYLSDRISRLVAGDQSRAITGD